MIQSNESIMELSSHVSNKGMNVDSLFTNMRFPFSVPYYRLQLPRNSKPNNILNSSQLLYTLLTADCYTDGDENN